MDDDVTLRPIREDDLDLIDRFWLDPESASEFEWVGFKDPKAFRRRWEEDGWLGAEHGELAVARAEEAFAGIVSWKDRTHGLGQALVYEVGIILLPEHRGQGIGATAQRLLVDYLFTHTPAHRIEAFTEVDNVREQRALEKAGFEKEGVMRDVIFRGGRWRSSCVYALIRPQ
jgi:RimJ/RimL family protein N-acetyltransferase